MEKQKLNSTIVYILAILGFFFFFFGGIGFVFSGIAFFIAHSKLKEAYANPDNYDNIEGMKTAKIVALVVLIINLLYLARVIYVISTVGWDEMMEQSEEMMRQWQQNA